MSAFGRDHELDAASDAARRHLRSSAPIGLCCSDTLSADVPAPFFAWLRSARSKCMSCAFRTRSSMSAHICAHPTPPTRPLLCVPLVSTHRCAHCMIAYRSRDSRESLNRSFSHRSPWPCPPPTPTNCSTSTAATAISRSIGWSLEFLAVSFAFNCVICSKIAGE